MDEQKEEKVDLKKEDIIEDIEEIEEIEETPKENDESSKVKDTPKEKAAISDNVISGDTTKSEIKVSEDDSTLTTGKKNSKKILIIVVLSILLVIDLAALVIYLIGIEKVISFIK